VSPDYKQRPVKVGTFKTVFFKWLHVTDSDYKHVNTKWHNYSPYFSLYISYGTSWEKLCKHRHFLFGGHFLYSCDL